MIGLLIGAAVATKAIGAIGESLENGKLGEGIKTLSQMKSRQTSNFYDNNIIMNISSYELRGNYIDVTNILRGIGFTNISYKEARYKRSFLTKNIEFRTENVSINGKTEFNKGDDFPKNAYVLITVSLYYDSTFVRPDNNIGLKAEYKTERFCEYCGCKLADSARFCERCGGPVTR